MTATSGEQKVMTAERRDAKKRQGMPKKKRKGNETQRVKKEPGAYKTTTRLSRRTKANT